MKKIKRKGLVNDLFTGEPLPSKQRTNKRGLNIPSRHRTRISRWLNLDYVCLLACNSLPGKTTLRAVNDIDEIIPVPFSKASRSKLRNTTVHFFEHDYLIERFWKSPKKYLKMLKKSKVVFGPDYSLFYDMPDEFNLWNIFRNKLCSLIMQMNGIKVIPNLSVCLPKFYDKIFEGIEPGGTYVVSNVKAFSNYFTIHEWYKFVREAIERLHPETLIIYGKKVSVAGVNVIYVERNKYKKREHGKQKP